MKKKEIEYKGITSLKDKNVFWGNSKIIDSIIKIRNGKIDIRTFIKSRVKIEGFFYEFIDESEIYLEGRISCVSEYLGEDNTTYIYTDTANIKFNENLDIRKKIINRKKSKLKVYIEDFYIERFNSREYLISVMLSIILE